MCCFGDFISEARSLFASGQKSFDISTIEFTGTVLSECIRLFVKTSGGPLNMNIIIEGYNKFDIIALYFEASLGMLLVYGI